MIRLALAAGLIEALGGLAPAVQGLVVLALVGVLVGVIFGGSERPLQRLLALIEALRAKRPA